METEVDAFDVLEDIKYQKLITNSGPYRSFDFSISTQLPAPAGKDHVDEIL